MTIKKGRHDTHSVTLTLNPSLLVILTLTLSVTKRKGKNLIPLRTGSVKGKGLAMTVKKRHALAGSSSFL